MARDYKAEYARYHGTPDQIAKRSQRNKARRLMEKEGLVRQGDGKEVDHKKPIDQGGTNARSNLQIMSRTANRKKGDR